AFDRRSRRFLAARLRPTGEEIRSAELCRLKKRQTSGRSSTVQRKSAPRCQGDLTTELGPHAVPILPPALADIRPRAALGVRHNNLGHIGKPDKIEKSVEFVATAIRLKLRSAREPV